MFIFVNIQKVISEELFSDQTWYFIRQSKLCSKDMNISYTCCLGAFFTYYLFIRVKCNCIFYVFFVNGQNFTDNTATIKVTLKLTFLIIFIHILL
jgi:hypothetical protein